MICSAVYRFLAILDIFPLYPIDHDTDSAAGLVHAGVTSAVRLKLLAAFFHEKAPELQFWCWPYPNNAGGAS